MKIVELIRANRQVGLTDDPQFDRASKYDWRRYVPDQIKEVWKDLSVEARVVAKVFAEEVANQHLAVED